MRSSCFWNLGGGTALVGAVAKAQKLLHADAEDAGGQRRQRGTGASPVLETTFSASYDEANRLTAITLNGEAFTIAYDDNGNLVSRSGPVSGTTTYGWSARNQLISLSGPAGAASFKYDALGRRIEKTVNGQSTGFLYDGAQAIAELKGSSLDTVYHTGIQIDEVLARYGSAGDKTLLTDALMSVIAQVNDDQSTANFYAYSPYGETVTLGPDSQNSLQYTGRENDATGLYYYRARYYDPVLKRFVSEDPIGIAGGSNVYAYVHGDPNALSDPSGNLGIVATAGIGLAAGAGGSILAQYFGKNGCIDWNDVGLAALSGAAAGAAVAALPMIIATVPMLVVAGGLVGGVTNAAQYAASSIIKGDDIDPQMMTISAGLGVGGGLIGGAIGAAGNQLIRPITFNPKVPALLQTPLQVQNRRVTLQSGGVALGANTAGSTFENFPLGAGCGCP